MRFLRRFLVAFKSGYNHATWGYSLSETWAHLRRPRPWRIVFGLLGSATADGCLACPTAKELRKVA